MVVLAGVKIWPDPWCYITVLPLLLAGPGQPVERLGKIRLVPVVRLVILVAPPVLDRAWRAAAGAAEQVGVRTPRHG
jgi:hypothetical protein